MLQARRMCHDEATRVSRAVYQRIMEAGKCVQAMGVNEDQVLPLIDPVGHRGPGHHVLSPHRG